MLCDMLVSGIRFSGKCEYPGLDRRDGGVSFLHFVLGNSGNLLRRRVVSHPPHHEQAASTSPCSLIR